MPVRGLDSVRRCNPISNRLTLSKGFDTRISRAEAQISPFNSISFLLPTSRLNTRFPSRNGTTRASLLLWKSNCNRTSA